PGGAPRRASSATLRVRSSRIVAAVALPSRIFAVIAALLCPTSGAGEVTRPRRASQGRSAGARISLTVRYPHRVDRVWAVLTSSEALAAWGGRPGRDHAAAAPGRVPWPGRAADPADPGWRLPAHPAPGRWKTFADPDGDGWVLQQDNPGFRRSRHPRSRRPEPARLLPRLVEEVPDAGQVQGEPGGGRGGDHFVVANRPARLGNRPDARAGQHLQAIGEREERIARRDRARRTVSRPGDRQGGRVDPVH